MLVQIDIDSTLYDADKLFGELAAEAGIKWPKRDNEWKAAEEIFKDDGTACSRIDLTNIFRKAHSYEYVLKQKPYPHAVEVIQGWVRDLPNLEIAYVSDRNEAQTGALKAWLDKNGFLPNEETHVAATADKREWMRENHPGIVIDDRVRTILMARYELGSKVIAFQHNHNINLKREADGIYVVKDWLEIDECVRVLAMPPINLIDKVLV